MAASGDDERRGHVPPQRPGDVPPQQVDVLGLPSGAPWLKAEYTDTDGTHWKELDVPQLVQHADFLGVAA